MKSTVWGHIERPWGYEIRVNFEADNGIIYNRVKIFSSKPENQKEIDAAVVELEKELENQIKFENFEKAKTPEPTKEEMIAKIIILEAEITALKTESIKAVK